MRSTPKKEVQIPSLAEFLQMAWAEMEPETALDWNWHLDAICLHVENVLMDWRKHRLDPTYVQRSTNLLINVPPGSMKSRIVSVCAPAWFWLIEPTWTSLFLSANPRVAARDAFICRDLLRSQWYRQTFSPSWELRKDKDAVSNFWNTAGGRRQSFGFNSKITGNRADAIFVDDPHDAQEVTSAVKRLAVLDKWDFAIANRVNSPASSVRLMIMQRLHQDDLAAHVYGQGDWDRLVIRQEFECDKDESVFGWTDPRTKEGELMHPTRFPPKVVEGFKVGLGDYGYAGQHQQRPAPRKGGMVLREWFIRADHPPLDELEIYQSWDTASKDDPENCPWVCTTWGVKDGLFYLLDVHRDRHKYVEGCEAAFRLALQWKPEIILIEQASTGGVLIQDFRQGVIPPGKNAPVFFSVLPIKTTQRGGSRSKLERLDAVANTIKMGRVVLPRVDTWVAKFLEELLTFPASRFSDQVDSTTQFLNWAQFRFDSVIATEEPELERLEPRRSRRRRVLHEL
ncbi:MAG: hypothetical protein AAGA67_01630 [Cyanobacteria bacterium P01_F01_bin.153]